MKPLLLVSFGLLTGCAVAAPSLEGASAEPRAAFTSSVPRIDLSDDRVELIGKRIWKSEAGGTVRALTFWPKPKPGQTTETFPSLCIGHFIWYPEHHPCVDATAPGDRTRCFHESFPAMLAFVKSSGVAVPKWAEGRAHAPWANYADFTAAFDDAELTELRTFCAANVVAETRYIIRRLQDSLPAMLASAPPAEKSVIEKNFKALAADSVGLYAMIDYVNFKGEGVDPIERRNGLGWGLSQALALMEASRAKRVNDRFADGVEAALRRRVQNSPPANRAEEESYLEGWLKRVNTYRVAKLEDLK